MDLLSIKHYYKPGDKELCVLRLSGYVDSTNSMELEKTFVNVLKSGQHKIIVDFSEVDYVSSAGWGIFVGQVKSLRDLGGDIRIAAMAPDVHEVFNILEFYHIIEDYPTLDEALQSFLPGGPEEAVTEEEPEQKEDPLTVFEPIENLLRRSGVKPSQSTRNTTQDKKVMLTADAGTKNAQPAPGAPKPEPARPIKRPVAAVSPPVQKKAAVRQIPLQEKIRKIIAEHPLSSTGQMRKMLRREDYGYTKIGRFKLRRLLKKMNLETKEKRYRYYLST